STPAALAARRATSTLPIVFTGVGDPVRTGLVQSLAHPGGNATGFATLEPELSAKRLDLLHQLVPNMTRFAMLWNDTNPSMKTGARYAEEAGKSLGLTVQSFGVHDLVDFDASFSAIRGGSSSAMLTLADPFTRANRQRIVDFAARSRLPAIYETGEFVEAGGLISYGPNLVAMQRRSATYIDKILNGAKPGDLPVQLPTDFELAVNMKTANALGIKVSDSILARADKVIQ
ncbi:MAG TPA: ABC transporter substrate-binding protein, partial [Sphingomicrobium sp.]|nr:ABC transporter substrate-binding protein [Sphingomicrobium sp.]